MIWEKNEILCTTILILQKIMFILSRFVLSVPWFMLTTVRYEFCKLAKSITQCSKYFDNDSGKLHCRLLFT